LIQLIYCIFAIELIFYFELIMMIVKSNQIKEEEGRVAVVAAAATKVKAAKAAIAAAAAAATATATATAASEE